MRSPPFNPARRALVARAAQAACVVAVSTGMGRSTPAAAKATKSEFMYQEHLHDGKSCGQCRFFVADDRDVDVGNCAIVDGIVRRDGWCIAFSPRNLA